MGLLSVAGKAYAKKIAVKIINDSKAPLECQQNILNDILTRAERTLIGERYHFRNIGTYDQFRRIVPVTDYEGMKDLTERIASGEKSVLWPGMPIYFAKTSGTTSGVKYIPITKDSIHNHIDSARNALLMYIYKTGRSSFADKKMIFLQGSPVLQMHGKVRAGRLSGIVAHYVPFYLKMSRMPSWKTNCIEDWEEKVRKIVDETVNQPMSLISGIPSWIRMYFEKLVERTGKPVGDIFPDFRLQVNGGVNFEPYRPVFKKLIGREVDTLELFPASEGFFAYQDCFPANDMLLNINSGIFFEFVPLDMINDPDAARIPLEHVATGIDYALIITSNAGLYSYSIGDTVRFTSLDPYRIKVTGRTAHYISAFGEHVISSEVESAVSEVQQFTDGRIAEFTVAPLINPSSGKSRHEWFIEFEKAPSSMEGFSIALDNALCKRNIYYNDLIKGHVLDRLLISELPSGTFNAFMKSKGMLGGQNKIPRLSNDRFIADSLRAV